MKCKQARRAVVLDYYGELCLEEKAGLADHLRICRKCAAERDETFRVLALLAAERAAADPAPDAERVWRGAESRLFPARAPRRRRAAWTAPQWSLAGAVLVLALAAGVFIGRGIFTPRPPADLSAEAVPASRPASGVKSVLAGHLEDLKPLLLEYANYSPETASGRKIPVEENLLRALMLQNILLRDALAKSDPDAAELLDDCDLILKEILNRNRLTAASPGEIQDLIRNRDVMFKLEIIKKL